MKIMAFDDRDELMWNSSIHQWNCIFPHPTSTPPTCLERRLAFWRIWIQLIFSLWPATLLASHLLFIFFLFLLQSATFTFHGCFVLFYLASVCCFLNLNSKMGSFVLPCFEGVVRYCFQFPVLCSVLLCCKYMSLSCCLSYNICYWHMVCAH